MAVSSLYTYQIVNSVDGSILEEVSFTEVRWSEGLQGRGGFTGQLTLDDPKASPLLLQTLSREVLVLRAGVPVFMGPIINVSPSLSTRTVTVQAASTWWWMSRRTSELSMSLSGAHIGDIAWQLVANAQAKAPGGDLRIIKSPLFPTTAQVANFVYDSGARTFVSDQVDLLAQQAPGFDYGIRLTPQTTGSPVREFMVWAPLRGVVADVTMSLGAGLIEATYTEDGTLSATRQHELGTGAGTTQYVLSMNTSDAGINAPIIEAVDSRDTSSTAELSLFAQADLFLKQWPSRAYATTFQPAPHLPFGAFWVGDVVLFDFALGQFGLVGQRRATDIEVTVGAADSEQLAVTWNEFG